MTQSPEASSMMSASATSASPRVLIMAGGTGGHVYPGIALAKKLIQEGCLVEWLGTSRGLESTVVPQNNIMLHTLSIAGLRGKGIKSLLLAPWRILQSIAQARRVLNVFKPQLVVGLGGYVAGPGGIAAWLKKIPLVIHEQNAVAGTTNKLLSRFAKKILTGFPKVFPQAQFIGNPVRDEFSRISRKEHCIREKIQAGASVNILIMGGSLGAKALNEIVPPALKQTSQKYVLSIYHQAGRGKEVDTQNTYATLGLKADIHAFVDDVADRLSWADLVICRAGALTIAEISNAGVASILVPYPFAIDDHQTRNAEWLANENAAVLMPQSTMSAESLAEVLQRLLADPHQLDEMAKNARVLAKPDATELFKQLCIEMIHVRN